ncbi:MAG TPA: hypothetical protein VLM85_12935 [Polyangiaceae bacterium]|nr:hypothetical protein [Polyangiaceae bacterium]
MRGGLLVALCVGLGGCKCGSGAALDGAAPWLDAAADVSVARAPELEELWTRAKDGDDDELARLAAAEGERGLEERATSGAYRATALRAMAFTPGFSALAGLGAAAQSGTDEEARAAVESADAIAARKRAQVDLEDHDELMGGCAALLETAKDAKRSREIRVGAVRALRMLVDYGCVTREAIPADVDVGAPAPSK